ncbi:distal membrane-arm assembly complex protein 1 [Labrus bergylta]|uniref:Distal membrane arm assembly complex 1 n=1 Tax=Labrus bergylta TaxID=56723 RepID=A0A3Q3GK87_9LABR|nr:distal membrane-arm assembly complex protein 1 [Labrus bergylta]
MSTTPEAPVSKPGQVVKNCWSCRLLCGGGLMLSGAYVFLPALRTIRQGGPTSMGTLAQMIFAASLTSWGLVVIANPMDETQRKT